MNEKKYSVIDLFCGCGGFSKGFQQAGYDIKLGIDLWSDAIVTYSENFSKTKVINADIKDIDYNQIYTLLKLDKNEIDVIIGGPPCQGFSISGKRMIDDPRNILYQSFVRLVGELKPKAFVMENVPGLIKLFDGCVKEKIISDFTKLGYNVNYRILSASDYGVPQNRNRVFFVGLGKEYFKNNQFFNFPKPTTEKQPITCEEAISDLDFVPDDVSVGETINYQILPQNDYQKKMRINSDFILNHSITLHMQKTKDIVSKVPDGGNYKDLPLELQNTRNVHIAWTRMNSKKPCFTIDTGHNHHFHYRANRVPTVRESARIQSFPDDFKFIGKKTSQLKQVGNAVPPLLSEAIAKSLMKTLRDNNV